MAEVYLGCSGYSYQDWKGTVYPSAIKNQLMLNYYVTKLPMVELNFSYYQMPKAEQLQKMGQKTPANFRFILKGHRSITHDQPRGQKEALLQFTQSLAPLQEQGKLGGVLLQFPNSFKFKPSNLAYLKYLREALSIKPLFIEFRDISWLNPEVKQFLLNQNLNFVAVDQPLIKGLIPPVIFPIKEAAYVRFHGRNAAKWYNYQQTYQRYDYLYTKEELQDWVPRIEALAKRSKACFIAFNNHYQGQSFKNALMMMELLADIKDLVLKKIS